MADSYYSDEHVTLYHGDCLEVMASLPAESVHAIVTDPPYGLGFMGRAWDDLPPGLPWAQECLRVLKPGGHLLAFGGSRTWHRLAVAVEDAGFEVRDSIAWLYGSGFPKSLDVSKAIDKARDDRDDVLQVASTLTELAAAAGITRADIDAHMGTSDMGGWWLSTLRHRCACPSVENWTRLRDFIPGAHVLDDLVWRLNGRKGQPGEAWATAEVVAVDRRMNEPSGVVNIGQGERVAIERHIKAANSEDAERWQGWGTALKPAFEPVVVARKPLTGTVAGNVLAHGTGALNIDGCRISTDEDRSRPPRTPNAILGNGKGTNLTASESNPAGRWPTNVLLDDTQAAELDRQSGESVSRANVVSDGRVQVESSSYGVGQGRHDPSNIYSDRGGASRFFPTFRYEAKAPTEERPRVNGVAHPTVKPLDLCRWLVRLVTPPGGTVLDPFAGSGTTAEACVIEGFPCIVIERETDYLPLIKARLTKPLEPVLDLGDLS